jgi:hypothetical protein
MNCSQNVHDIVHNFDPRTIRAENPSMCHQAESTALGSTGAEHLIPETNRIRLILFSMQNRTLGPYLAAINRIFISLVPGRCSEFCPIHKWGYILQLHALRLQE